MIHCLQQADRPTSASGATVPIRLVPTLVGVVVLVAAVLSVAAGAGRGAPRRRMNT